MGNSWLTWLATEAAWGVQAARCAVGTGQSGLKIDCRAIYVEILCGSWPFHLYLVRPTQVSRKHCTVKMSVIIVYNR